MSVPLRLRALVLPLALLAAFPATASADAVVSTDDGGATVAVDSDALEHNVITVSVSDDRVRVMESISGGAITAGPGCNQDSEDIASCPAVGVQRVRVWLGDGDDDFHGRDAGGLRLEVHGEAGNDELADGPAGDLLDGGSGWDDVVRPSGGDDEIIGGDGDSDLVSYLSYTEAVDVALPAANATSTGNGGRASAESDTIHGDVEDVRGGFGPDVIIGNGLANALGGGPGADDISAGEGNDIVNGQSDPDTLSGGGGYDRLNAADGFADDAVDCGAGDDDLDADNSYDPSSTGCEIIAPEFTGLSSLVGPHFRAGDWVTLSLGALTARGPLHTQATWTLCNTTGCSPSSRGDASGYRLSEADVGGQLYAHAVVANRAGSAQTTTPMTPKIGPRPPQPPATVTPPIPEPPVEEQPPIVVVAPPVESPQERLARLAFAVDGALDPLARAIADANPRRLARRGSARHRFLFPEDGTVALRWVVRGRMIASGRADGAAGQRSTVVMRLTPQGRRMLRRAKQLPVTLTATFVGGAARKATPAVGSVRFTLRRGA